LKGRAEFVTLRTGQFFDLKPTIILPGQKDQGTKGEKGRKTLTLLPETAIFQTDGA